jgi:hypothetical protein
MKISLSRQNILDLAAIVAALSTAFLIALVRSAIPALRTEIGEIFASIGVGALCIIALIIAVVAVGREPRRQGALSLP